MKRKGDGFIKIKYEKCVWCNKKGMYVASFGITCKYCKKSAVGVYHYESLKKDENKP